MATPAQLMQIGQKVVEMNNQGNYEELLSSSDLFAELARFS